MELAIKILKREEGFRREPYHCSAGHPTIGYGLKIGTKGAPIEQFDFTIPEYIASIWLGHLVFDLERKLDQYTWFTELSEVRKAVIISMAYQLGVTGLLGFEKMINALQNKNYYLASVEALDSKWAKIDSIFRAERHADMLVTDELDRIYK